MYTDLKDAVRAAQQFALELFGEKNIEDLKLEEIEASDGKNKWLVTLSWTESAPPAQPASTGNPFALLNRELGRRARTYKQFVVDDGSGEVVAMKIRAFDK